MRALKRLFVFLALIGLLLPACRSVAVAAHLLVDHDHNHDHESGTPDHDHPVTLQASSTSTPIRLAPALATPIATAPAGPIGPLLLRRTAAPEAPAWASNADPPAPESLSVFRI